MPMLIVSGDNCHAYAAGVPLAGPAYRQGSRLLRISERRDKRCVAHWCISDSDEGAPFGTRTVPWPRLERCHMSTTGKLAQSGWRKTTYYLRIEISLAATSWTRYLQRSRRKHPRSNLETKRYLPFEFLLAANDRYAADLGLDMANAVRAVLRTAPRKCRRDQRRAVWPGREKSARHLFPTGRPKSQQARLAVCTRRRLLLGRQGVE